MKIRCGHCKAHHASFPEVRECSIGMRRAREQAEAERNEIEALLAVERLTELMWESPEAYGIRF